MAKADPIVFIVDDEATARHATEQLMRALGLRVESFESAAEFLDEFDPQQPGCLILDIRMPGMSGLELQQHLRARGAMIPILFVTGHGDVSIAVQAMKAGAVDFLQKPFGDHQLVDRVRAALARDQERREELADRVRIEKRMESLTARETEVMNLVVDGKANKQIAFELGLSPRTVEIHRARVMSKMAAASLPDLVRMVLSTRQED